MVISDAPDLHKKFDPTLSRLNLYLPIFGIVILILSFNFAGLSELLGENQSKLSFLSKVIFLNNIHVVFTLVLVMSIPSMRNWVAHSDKDRKVSLKVQLVLLSVLFGILVLIRENREVIVGKVIFTLLGVYAYFHVVKQSMGMSFLYNRFGGTVEPKSANLERWERGFVFLSICLQGLIIAVTTFHPVGYFAASCNYLVIASLIATALFTIRTFLSKGPNRIFRTVHTFRYFILSLMIISPIALVFAGMIHGLEYLMVCKNIWRKSGAKVLMVPVFAWLMLLFVVIASVLNPTYGIFAFFTPSDEENIFTSLPLNTLYATIPFLHYFLDGLIFQMRSKHVREFILPNV